MKFRPYNQSQGIFKTLIPDELLDLDHPVRIIDKVVEILNLSDIEDEYEEEGNIAYHVKMMIKVLFYAFFRDVFSCRKICDRRSENPRQCRLAKKQGQRVESVNGNDQKNKGWHQHYLRGI